MGDKAIRRRDFLRLGTALVGAAAFGGLASTTKRAVADTTTFPGIRWYPVMGTYAGTQKGWVSEPTLVDDQYSTYVGAVGSARERAYLNLDNPDRRVYFTGGRKITWKDLLVDPTLAPTSRAQGQNPGWTNYKWTRAGQDYIQQQLDSSKRIAEGKAKLAIFVATTATSVKNPVPAWMMNHPDRLAWRDGQGKDHVRFDKTLGWQYAADFLTALIRRYGNDPRVASITHGEYYTNADGGGLPADFDYNVFRSNAKLLWKQVVDLAPRDANSERTNFAQSMPITQGGFVTVADLVNIGVGTSGSGVHLFKGGDLDRVRKELYGKVPQHHQVNVPLGQATVWDGTPNPWGFARGQSVALRYEHAAWYHGSKGPIPLDSLMLREDAGYVSQWHEAFGKFAPNGTHVAQWGQIPNYPPVAP